MSPFNRTIFSSAAALAVGATWAQTPPAAPPQTAPAAPSYSSAFEGYRPFQAGEVQDWRKSNDTVREIGGWRAYAREIQGGASPVPAQPATAAPAPAPAPAPALGQQARPADPHQGHHK